MELTQFFKPVIKFLMSAFITIAIDMISGVTRALILKKFSSFKFRKGIVKFIEYTSAILLAFVFSYITGIIDISKAVCIVIIVIESTSIIENVSNSDLKEKLKNALGVVKNVTK